MSRKKILIIGSGAREHCIAKVLSRSSDLEIYAILNSLNPGILKLVKGHINSDICNPSAVADYAQKVNPDLAVVGPEAPLGSGVSDALLKIGIPCIGPKRCLARIETSKGYCRQIMAKHNIPGLPEFKVFESMSGVQDFMNTLPGVVVKPDGLTGGKGVWVEGDHFEDISESMDYAQTYFDKGEKVVIEEKLEGEEFSQFYFTDGKTVIGMPIAQDHKRALEGDKGPNTGGMGSYSDANHLLPFITRTDVDEATQMTKSVIKALKEDTGEDYKGIIYGGFIKTRTGVKLIEYNARFGDPEVMNVLPIISSDLYEIFKHIVNGTLEKAKVDFAKKATVCKYVVPEGYPTSPVKNEEIRIKNGFKNVETFFGSVDEKDGVLILKGSRAVGFVGIAETISEAEKAAESAAASVEGPVFHRSDIGTKELIEKKGQHMREVLKE